MGKMKPNKACGPDCLPIDVAKALGEEGAIWMTGRPYLSQTCFLVKTGTACCKRFDAKQHIYTYLGTKCTWTTLTDLCWKFVGTI